MKLFYRSAPIGAGKTYGAISWALSRAKLGRKFMILSPTIELCEQSFATAKALQAQNPKYKTIAIDRIHSQDGYEESPVKRLMRHCREAEGGGEILLATHAAFYRVPFFAGKGNWGIILDEAPALDKTFWMHLPVQHTILTDHVAVEDYTNLMYRVLPVNDGALEEIARNEKNDEILAKFADIAHCIVSPHFDVFVEKDSWCRTIAGDTERGKVKLFAIGMLRPEIFEDWDMTILLGANFEESLIYKYWQNEFEVEWQALTRLSLRYDEHRNGDRLEIRYVLSGRKTWSKKAGQQEYENGQTYRQAIIDGIAQEFGDEEFLLLTNKDGDDEAKRICIGRNFTILPQSSHGLNSYGHIHNFVSVAAFHLPGYHSALYRYWGISPDEIRRAIHIQAIYQAVGRSSIRDPNATAKVRVFVPDESTAVELAGYFNCGCGVIGGTLQFKRVNPKRKYESDAERMRLVRETRERLAFEQEAADLSANSFYLALKDQCSTEHVRVSFVNTYKENPNKNGGTSSADDKDLLDYSGEYFFGSFFADTWDKHGSLISYLRDEDEVVSRLREFWQDNYGIEKEQNVLICPSVFATNANRKRENVLFARAVLLDFDGGNLPSGEFAKMFPDIKMLCYNTWSSKDRTRFRAWIFLSDPVGAETYAAICKEIEAKLKAKGYVSKKARDMQVRRKGVCDKPLHGLDFSKMSAENMMFLPCQAGIEGGVSFFEEYREGRKPWQVDMTTAIVPEINRELVELIREVEEDPQAVGKAKSYAETRLDKAVDDIRTAPVGDRHGTIVKKMLAMLYLAQKGWIDTYKVISELTTAGALAGKPRAEIISIEKWARAKVGV